MTFDGTVAGARSDIEFEPSLSSNWRKVLVMSLCTEGRRSAHGPGVLHPGGMVAAYTIPHTSAAHMRNAVPVFLRREYIRVRI